MPFVSYAQNFEDVMLWRALKDVDQGFYIDVGAGEPRQDSVTCAFSERGWRGINIEPNSYCFAKLVEHRPRDINLPKAAGDRTGTLRMSIVPGTGLSSGNPSIAKIHVSADFEVEIKDVELTTLSAIWSNYVPAGQEVHFLKIDAAGLETEVIRGNDWLNNRPWIVVVDATYLNSSVEHYVNWEEYLANCGYDFCYADGLNRFYVAQEHSDLIVHFKYPPNICDGFHPPNKFDRFVTIYEADLRQALSEAHAQLEQARAQIEQARLEQERARLDPARTQTEQLEHASPQVNQQLGQMRAQLEQERAQLGQLRVELNQHTSETNDLRQARAELNQRMSMLEAQLLAVTSSSSWRITDPLRRLVETRSLRTRRNLRRVAKAAWWSFTPWHIPARIRLLRKRNVASKAALQKHSESRLIANENTAETVQQQPASLFATLSDGELECELALCVDLMYRCYLGRGADADGLRTHVASLRNGIRLSTLARVIENCPEAVQRRKGGSEEFRPVANGNSAEAVEHQPRSHFDALSDGEFVVAMAEFLFQGRGAFPEEVEHWKNALASGRAKRNELLMEAMKAFLDNRGRKRIENDPAQCWIMGTDRWLFPSDWENKARELSLLPSASPQSGPKSKQRRFRHSGEYVVSALASLYKGGRYIEQFLKNITGQTMFDRSELIIIDADSPEGEEQIIAEYQRRFPNIVYKRINFRLGIYDAWNVGVEMARGRYLTNTNLDDLRRRDSFELQAATLDRYDFIDVVYQDFFYNLDGSLSFEEIEKFGFRSDLPIVTPHNLLKFNSPHNAPMWRKALHAEVGLFDTTYRSAGDWEFWLRCVSNGKNFLKINTPHVAYFQNPQGLSTRPDSRGTEEIWRILRSYSDKLISRELRLSREGLAEALGTQADWDLTTSHYDVVQHELNRLGARFREESEMSGSS